ncbi:ATP-binding cassette domain-containing protein [Lactonifactor sp. BIOML-A3]|uniref:ABC transporter ATP-binding protein n=1 Tax=unclassified Lactonifactor TaxID=2636670 RepID=UPI0012AF4062|nr:MULTISPECIES: ABC transporter ATP-binding protein [unclassified Lactonifactor]MSA02806.1 ATP-binding cassette domain-containing protein [Lactonifactor sp. BIOML-A5]MSA09100.1 ATP-binding cassette domain-containing protein [Lactonifactor sp. BIOML-A4]MSA13764.1 ATP-binding cassette domain-containing protein [Lactonifactor sp. BIOML-A3]MSA18097.1 ATP-binding cassette domain-containing protein [Lactonifactor sp. BIOML-A2]MSA39006.1 ATP-binding cassette domain-containing protein [Lactonifactor 
MNTILEVKHLTKEYEMGKNNRHRVLHDVSIAVEKGEFISVMGPSGSGKSTLLYAISGMDRATQGSVRFCDMDFSALSEDELAEIRLHRMGFVFQQSNLLKNLNLFDNILLSACLSKRETKQEIKDRGKKLMEQTGILQLADRHITQASGGQLQRASICRALMNQPEILFGDEPTGALNSKAAEEIMNILLKINEKGTTILLVTHDVKVAAKTQRVLYMMDGVIAGEKHLGKYQGETGDLKSREQKLAGWLSSLGL